MDILRSFQSHEFNIKSLTNFSNLSLKAQNHLVAVYKTLCVMLLLATFGVLIQIKLQVDIMFCGIAAVGFLMWLIFTPFQAYNPKQQQKRLILLGTVAFLKGTAIGPLVHLAMTIDPTIVFTALAGTALIFGCFSAAAMCAKRRSYLYLIGFLSSAASLLCLLSLVNLFLRSSELQLVQVYGGLMVFCGYVVYDTQLIIVKADQPNPDYIQCALELFIDFAAIFVRILIILLRNSQSKQENKRRGDRR